MIYLGWVIFHWHPIRISFVKDTAAAWKAAQEAMDIPEGNSGGSELAD